MKQIRCVETVPLVSMYVRSLNLMNMNEWYFNTLKTIVKVLIYYLYDSYINRYQSPKNDCRLPKIYSVSRTVWHKSVCTIIFLQSIFHFERSRKMYYIKYNIFPRRLGLWLMNLTFWCSSLVWIYKWQR